MRRALVLFALFACAITGRADAQQALAQSVTLPSGVTVQRACDELTSEGVLVASLDDRALPAQGAEYFAQLAQVIARRVQVRAGDPPRTATYGALLMRDGALAHQIPVARSGDRELDARIDEALEISPRDADRAPAPAGMPDSLRVVVTFGQHEDGSPFVASHVRCPAVAFPDNPRNATPAWAMGQSRTVVVSGVISPAGRVDTASARVDDESDDRYVEAAMRA
ncbi:MAG: hypothetical protein JJD97_11110, partial [Gemmatimonadaceae bacterium]|nr:hypothetical protein [Gemmatimonadaceae bacterium]